MKISNIRSSITIVLSNPREEIADKFQDVIITSIRDKKEDFGIKKIEEKENVATISSSKLTISITPLEVEISSKEKADSNLLEKVLSIVYTLYESLVRNLEKILCLGFVNVYYDGNFSNFYHSICKNRKVETNKGTLNLSGLKFEVEKDPPCPFEIYIYEDSVSYHIEECVGNKSLCEKGEPFDDVDELTFEEKINRVEEILSDLEEK